MIKDSKRREVARRLRELDMSDLGDDRGIIDTTEESGALFALMLDEANDYRPGLHYAMSHFVAKDAVGLFADLIDRPTCKNDSEFGSHTVTVCNYSQDECFDFVCSRCGLRLSGDEMDNSPLMDEEFGHRALRYCPSCGAEVE